MHAREDPPTGGGISDVSKLSFLHREGFLKWMDFHATLLSEDDDLKATSERTLHRAYRHRHVRRPDARRFDWLRRSALARGLVAQQDPHPPRAATVASGQLVDRI